MTDGKGCWRDNVFVERLWKSVKYEHVYLHAYETTVRRSNEAGLSTSTSTTAAGRTPVLTDRHLMTCTSISRRYDWRLNPQSDHSKNPEKLSDCAGPLLSRKKKADIKSSDRSAWKRLTVCTRLGGHLVIDAVHLTQAKLRLQRP